MQDFRLFDFVVKAIFFVSNQAHHGWQICPNSAIFLGKGILITSFSYRKVTWVHYGIFVISCMKTNWGSSSATMDKTMNIFLDLLTFY